MKCIITRTSPDELMHFGIKGQKWGVRRFENPDGTLTEAGKERYQKANYKRLKSISNNNFYLEGRTVLPTKKMDELIKLTEEYRKKTKGMDESDPRRNEEYLKNGGVNDKVKEIISETLGKYQNKIGNTKMERLVKWMADEAVQRKEENRESFKKSRKEIGEKGFESWWKKVRETDDEDRFFEHIWDTKGDLISSWMSERYKTNSDKEWDALQSKYTKRLIRELGLPNTRDTEMYIQNWFINGDD